MMIPMMLDWFSSTETTVAQSSGLAAPDSLGVSNLLYPRLLRKLPSEPGRSTPVNRSRVGQVLLLASLSILPSCTDGSVEERDPYREIVDISRNPEALREYLKPIPPTEPAEALKTFETTGGFRMELVAQEPEVVEPLSATFDENGRMYVAEFYGYPRQPPAGRGRYGKDSAARGPGRRRPLRDGTHLRRQAGLAHRCGGLEAGSLRLGAAGPALLQGHGWRRSGRHPREGLHRIRCDQRAADAQQHHLGRRPQDLRIHRRQRRLYPSWGSARCRAHSRSTIGTSVSTL